MTRFGQLAALAVNARLLQEQNDIPDDEIPDEFRGHARLHLQILMLPKRMLLISNLTLHNNHCFPCL